MFCFRAEQLQKEASELKDRIKHLNDMVFCQQRKVKGMIEEVSAHAVLQKRIIFLSSNADSQIIIFAPGK